MKLTEKFISKLLQAQQRVIADRVGKFISSSENLLILRLKGRCTSQVLGEAIHDQLGQERISSTFIDLSKTGCGFDCWEPVVDSLKEVTQVVPIKQQKIYDSVQRVESSGDDFDKVMENEIDTLQFDNLIYSSIMTFDTILKTIDSVEGGVRHFVFVNADLSQYHLFNVLHAWALQKTRSRSIKFWFVVDLDYRENQGYIDILESMIDLEKISLQIMDIPKPTVDALTEALRGTDFDEEYIEKLALDAQLNLAEEDLFHQGEIFDSIYQVGCELGISIQVSLPTLELPEREFSYAEALAFGGFDDVNKKLENKNYGDYSDLEKLLAGLLFYLSPNLANAEGFFIALQNKSISSLCIKAVSLQMFFVVYGKEGAKELLAELIAEFDEYSGNFMAPLYTNCMRVGAGLLNKSALNRLKQQKRSMFPNLNDFHYNLLALTCRMTLFCEKEFLKQEYSKRDYTENFKVVRKVADHYMTPENLPRLLQQVNLIKQINWANSVVKKDDEASRKFRFLYFVDLDLQRKFSGIQKHLIPISNIARMYNVTHRNSDAARYFQLAIAVSHLVDPETIYQAIGPKMDLMVFGGILNHSIVEDLEEFCWVDSPTNVGGVCSTTHQLILELYGFRPNRKFEHPLNKTKLSTNRYFNKVTSLGLKGDQVSLQHLFDHADDDVIYLNKDFLSKLCSMAGFECYLLETKRKIGGLVRLAVNLNLHRILVMLSPDANTNPEVLAKIRDVIEVEFLTSLYHRWYGKHRQELFESPMVASIFADARVRPYKTCQTIWESFFDHLENYLDLRDILQFLLLNLQHLYNLDRVECRMVHPTNPSDVMLMSLTRGQPKFDGIKVSGQCFQIDIEIGRNQASSIKTTKKDVVVKGAKVEICLHGIEFNLQASHILNPNSIRSLQNHFLNQGQLLYYALNNYINKEKTDFDRHQLESAMNNKLNNSIKLAAQVKNYTTSLFQKNRKISAIMDNIPLGVFTFDQKLHIDSEYSTRLESLVGKDSLDKKSAKEVFMDLLELSDEKRSMLESSIGSMLGEHIVGYDANQFHLPHQVIFHHPEGEKKLSLNWAPICDEYEKIERMLVSIEDITEAEALKKEKRKQEAVIQIVEKLINIDVETLNGFIASSLDCLRIDKSGMVSETAFKHQYKKLMHNAHTIKGNARILGFDDVSELCHSIESDYTNLMADIGDLESIQNKHSKIGKKIELIKFVNDEKLGRKPSPLKMNDAERAVLVEIVNQHCATDVARSAREKLMHLLNLDKLLISDVIAASIKGVEKTAAFLEKPKPVIKIYEIGKVLPRAQKTTFVEIFNHLFNNAMDHSIELPDLRRDRGKPESGKINIEVSRQEDLYEICFYDDGQGVNIEKLKKTVVQKGIPLHSDDEDELLATLFHDGISTSQQVSKISGRGVGMSAIKELVESIGGEIRIFSMRSPVRRYPYVPIIFKIFLPTFETKTDIRSAG